SDRSHPERREGSVATGTQSKDPVGVTMNVPVQSHGILRRRAAPPLPPGRSAQDDSRFCWFTAHKKSRPPDTTLRMTREEGLQTRPRLRLVSIIFALLSLVTARGDEVSFQRDVWPIFKRHCVGCHSEQKTKGKLRLDDVAALRKGGKTGPLFVA